MEQVYLIKKTSEKGFEFVEIAYNDYTDARRMALKLVDSYNKKTQKKYYYSKQDECAELAEMLPDIWSNGIYKIEIMALKMKRISNSKQIQHKKNIIGNYRKYEEVYL